MVIAFWVALAFVTYVTSATRRCCRCGRVSVRARSSEV